MGFEGDAGWKCIEHKQASMEAKCYKGKYARCRSNCTSKVI